MLKASDFERGGGVGDGRADTLNPLCAVSKLWLKPKFRGPPTIERVHRVKTHINGTGIPIDKKPRWLETEENRGVILGVSFGFLGHFLFFFQTRHRAFPP
jgi:hypothetical protein